MATHKVSPAERWLPVAGYEGFYEVSDQGLVRNALTGRVLRAASSANLYLKVSLCYKGQTTAHVHSLVAEAFIGPRPEGMDVNHIDGDKRNNDASNLEYVTRAGNLRHAVETGLAPPVTGSQNGKAKLTEDAVRLIRRNALMPRSEMPELAARYGVSIDLIYRVARGMAWRHLAYRPGESVRPPRSPK